MHVRQQANASIVLLVAVLIEVVRTLFVNGRRPFYQLLDVTLNIVDSRISGRHCVHCV